jgi:hypothetical protein
MKNEELSDNELFDQAVTDEGLEDVSTQQTEQQVETTEERHTEQATSEAESQERQQVDDSAPQVPSWRVREINEEKRRFAEENERLKAEMAELRRTQQQRQPEKKEDAADDGPDPLLDPKGYAKRVRDEIREELLAERREDSLQRAAKAYKDEFSSAYEMAQKQIDPALRAKMQASRDPGETLIEWYRDQKTRAEIGGDLASYKQRLREEALKDPEFRKQAMEAWRSDAQPQSNGRPRVELPPTLNGASRANASLRSDATSDVSDRELFEQIAG